MNAAEVRLRSVAKIAERLRCAEMKRAAALTGSSGAPPRTQIESLQEYVHFDNEARLLRWVMGEEAPGEATPLTGDTAKEKR